MNKADEFFKSKAYAVIGASKDRQKFGNKVLRCYLQHHLPVYAVNPIESHIEGVDCFSDIMQLPQDVQSISIITPPPVTERIVLRAIEKGIKNIWMQPGAESDAAIELGEANGINVIANGPCILVQLGFDE